MDEEGSAGSDLSQGAGQSGAARGIAQLKTMRPDGLQLSVGLTTACFELRVAVISLSTSLISKGFIR